MRSPLAYAAIAWTLASPAGAVVIECLDGTVCAVADPKDCPCVEVCPGGRWHRKGDGFGCEIEALETRAKQPPLDPGAVALSVVFVAGSAAAYFLPSIVASRRKHHQADAIVLLNLLLGWTVLGWIAALVWSASAVRTREG